MTKVNIQYQLLEKLVKDIDKAFDNSKRVHLIQMFVKDKQYNLYAINEYERTEFRLMEVKELNIQGDDVVIKEKIIFRGDDYRELISKLNAINKGIE